MPSALTLRERSSATYVWTDEDLRGLDRMAPSGALVAGIGKLQAGGWIGFARLPSGSVRVVPKSGPLDADRAAANVLSMLARIGDLPRAPRPDELQVAQGDWIEALIVLFANSLSDALARGPILRSTRVRDEASPALRGRLRLASAAARPARAHVFPVEYAERRPNSPPMQALKWSVARLSPLSRSTVTRTILQRLERDLALVPLVSAPPLAWFEASGLSRHEVRFSAPLALAKLLRLGLTAALAPGDIGAIAFWVDMDGLFERLAIQLSRRIVPSGWTVTAQDRTHFLGEVAGSGEFRLVPDLLLRDPVGPKLVIDTKNKPWNGRPEHGDVYAMAHYVRRYGVERGILLYPKPQNANPIQWRIDLHDGGSIEARFLDLTDDLTKPDAWDKMEDRMKEVLSLG